MTDARAIADEALRVPGVAGLTGGPFGTVATYLPGERLAGVAVRDDGVEISIAARAGHPLPDLADDVRRAVAGLVGPLPVNIRIDDLVEDPPTEVPPAEVPPAEVPLVDNPPVEGPLVVDLIVEDLEEIP
ncbi:Asp23/Gls24 family envelope stress response protein [Nonomuraea typhae]|uniref:Asp23/Gls24 family envelope stress response protein n=1 Tax=Nonomuraea typhae TaxID=2603600 RepID=UPI0015E247FA|nr:Asp23/Gls24 family envelope stress response protein [Nonomuraea typhae]